MDILYFGQGIYIIFFGLLVNLPREIRPIRREDRRAPFYVGCSENIEEFFLNVVLRDAVL